MNSAGKTQDDVCMNTNKALFPIIGIGTSACGLEAYEQFFRHTPKKNGGN